MSKEFLFFSARVRHIINPLCVCIQLISAQWHPEGRTETTLYIPLVTVTFQFMQLQAVFLSGPARLACMKPGQLDLWVPQVSKSLQAFAG